ncbi:unnamed protein product [Prorocentrum cordatum]|uniref:Uncharacterized protein n=1 Tax=Prorocentrum cordatum TaxID=2364126 RepID=A0ABN9T5M7_9DINO|nr:unnamed protein product [Polarella glacialis]
MTRIPTSPHEVERDVPRPLGRGGAAAAGAARRRPDAARPRAIWAHGRRGGALPEGETRGHAQGGLREGEFTVELNLAKAREAGTPLGLKVDIESEFAPPSLKVISDDIVRDRLALSCVVAVSIPRRILSAPVPHRHPSRLKTPRCPAQPVGISGPRPVL